MTARSGCFGVRVLERRLVAATFVLLAAAGSAATVIPPSGAGTSPSTGRVSMTLTAGAGTGDSQWGDGITSVVTG